MYIHFEFNIINFYGKKRQHGHQNTHLNPRLCEKTGWRDYNYENRCN
jgi:hypothetical protein